MGGPVCRCFISINPPGVAGIALGGTRRPGRQKGFRAAAPVTRAQRPHLLSESLACALGQGRRRATPSPPGCTSAKLDCSRGGGTASRRRRERRSTGQNDNRLAANATERQATARFRLSRPGRSVPTREAGTTPGRIARKILQRRSLHVDSFVRKSLNEEI